MAARAAAALLCTPSAAGATAAPPSAAVCGAAKIEETDAMGLARPVVGSLTQMSPSPHSSGRGSAPSARVWCCVWASSLRAASSAPSSCTLWVRGIKWRVRDAGGKRGLWPPFAAVVEAGGAPAARSMLGGASTPPIDWCWKVHTGESGGGAFVDPFPLLPLLPAPPPGVPEPRREAEAESEGSRLARA